MLVALFILLTFRQYGISNDEEVQHTYGRLLLDFYRSGFTDQAAFHYKNLYLYGGLFDIIAAILEKITPLWLWDMRHLLSAGFGFVGLIAAWKTGNELQNARTGFFALALLTATAAWSGAMFTHTKDIPFAAFMTWALYYTILACKAAPQIPRAICIKLGIAIGCALGMRIGGGFAVIYLILALLFTSLVQTNNLKNRVQFLWQCTLQLLPAALIAFCLMAVFWPWGVMSPQHPEEAIRLFSHFSFDMLTIDDGKVTSIGAVPRYYLLSYLLVKIPEVFLLGLLSVCLLFIANFKKLTTIFKDQNAIALMPVIIAVALPLAYVLCTKPALYNGVRHFTFVLPPLAILAAVGIDKTLAFFQASKKFTAFYLGTCCVLFTTTLVELIQLHPYEYVYYNHFAGPSALIDQKWEGDYWSSSLREAAKTLTDLPLAHRKTPYLVAVCAETIQGSAYLDKRFKITKDWSAADFYLSSTNMGCDQALSGKVIANITRMKNILSVVKDRRALPHTPHISKPGS